MQAKVSDRVGGLKVHKRVASAVLVEPCELWPGYHVEILEDYQGRQKLWSRIRYTFNNKTYEGWVIKEALDVERLPDPPDIDPLGAPLPDSEPKPVLHRTWGELVLTVVLISAAVLLGYCALR